MILGSGLLQSSGWTPTWLIRDEFTDTVAAGSVDGTAATPGPGTRAVTDAGNTVSVGGGAMAASGPFGLWYGQQTPVQGLSCITKVAIHSEYIYFGWDNNTSGVSVAGSFFFDALNTIYAYGSGTPIGTWDSNAGFYAIVHGDPNLWVAHNGDAWKILWVQRVSVGTYPFLAIAISGEVDVDYLRVLALPAPFDSDDGLATDTHSGSVATGTTFVHEADCLIEYTLTTRPTADNADVLFRAQDASNYWVCRVNSSGDISLVEVASGTPTTRGTAAGVVSSGHRVVIVADGTTIKVYSNNTLRITYASATNFATATAGEVDALGTGGVISDLKTWPRTLSGTAAGILNKASA